jgi:hypothetical protein
MRLKRRRLQPPFQAESTWLMEAANLRSDGNFFVV